MNSENCKGPHEVGLLNVFIPVDKYTILGNTQSVLFCSSYTLLLEIRFCCQLLSVAILPFV